MKLGEAAILSAIASAVIVTALLAENGAPAPAESLFLNYEIPAEPLGYYAPETLEDWKDQRAEAQTSSEFIFRKSAPLAWKMHPTDGKKQILVGKNGTILVLEPDNTVTPWSD